MPRSRGRGASDAVDGELRREVLPELFPVFHVGSRSVVFRDRPAYRPGA